MSKKIKVSEIFNSLQGEGRYVGVPSLFLRTFGCNFRCPGFGRDHSIASTPNEEVLQIIKEIPIMKEKGVGFESLPLVSTGCDTYAAVYPEFKDFSPVLTVDEIVSRIKKLVPNGFSSSQHLVITGGEPLLPGWQKVYPNLFAKLFEEGLVKNTLFVTFETNGTQELIPFFWDNIPDNVVIHFSVSIKLAASGESRDDAIITKSIDSLLDSDVDVDFKFVVKTEEHVKEIKTLFSTGQPLERYNKLPIYLMPVGGLNEDYQLNKKRVAQLAMENSYRYSPRLQNDLFGNEWGT